MLCLADWVLIEDLGFFGGLGTDPNSMIPMALLVVAGLPRLRGRPGRRAVPAARPSRGHGHRRRLRGGLALRRLGTVLTTLDTRTVIAAWALVA